MAVIHKNRWGTEFAWEPESAKPCSWQSVQSLALNNTMYKKAEWVSSFPSSPNHANALVPISCSLSQSYSPFSQLAKEKALAVNSSHHETPRWVGSSCSLRAFPVLRRWHMHKRGSRMRWGWGQRKDKGLDAPWTFLSLVLCPPAGEMRHLSSQSQFPQLQKGSKTGLTGLIWG